MKITLRKIFICLLLVLLTGCNSTLPKPEVATGLRGEEFGIDANINEETIDNYLNRSDTVYIDCRMLKDEANYETIGGDSYLSGYIKGFEVVPFPYLCTVSNLPAEVGNTYSGATLYTLTEDNEYIPNFEESLSILESLFPKNKNIFLICGGGGYAGMCKNMLIALGWDADKIYNIGGYWYYTGENSVSTLKDDGTYDYSGLVYHDIDFSSLTPVDGYTIPDNSSTDKEVTEPNITELTSIEEFNELIATKQTFILLINLEGCMSCATFKPIVEEFAASKQVNVYSMSVLLTKDIEELKDIKYTPSLAVYKDGELCDYLDSTSDEDTSYYKNAYNLSRYIKKYLDIQLINGSSTNEDSDCETACEIK